MEDAVHGQCQFSLVLVFRRLDIEQIAFFPLAQQLLLKVNKVPTQAGNAERRLKVLHVLAAEDFDHVAEIVDRVVDRRRREHEHLLLGRPAGYVALKSAIARLLHAAGAAPAWIPEVVRLVDDDDVRVPQGQLNLLLDLAAALQVGVIE